MTATPPVLGAPLARIEGPVKVTGSARYAVEYAVDDVTYAWPVLSTVARGTVRSLDAERALARPGVLAVLWHANAPRLHETQDAEMMVLQSPAVSYRGQPVAVVVATTQEEAREAATTLQVDYAQDAHDVELRVDHPTLYKPEKVNPDYETDTEQGDVEQALTAADVRIDHTYETPGLHNNPMEPHATTVVWDGDRVTLYDSSQGSTTVAQTIAEQFGLAQDDVRVIAEHVGGGFGSKGSPRPNVVLAVMAARVAGRPVKLALPRQAMFSLVGYRTPTIQRVQLGAGADGHLTAIAHDVVEQTSTVVEFAEQTASPTRTMYAAPNRRTTHRLARLDVPTPRWMRAPGECPGMYALESAMDELAVAAGIDPIELRIRNEPDVDPETGEAFSSRNLVGCLRHGAERFGWAGRDPRPAARREGRDLVGTGVAASMYPAMARPATAHARLDESGRYAVRVNGTDIGTGARTVLTQIAADALGVGTAAVEVSIGDSSFGPAPVAGGSAGTASWGWAVVKACRQLRARIGDGVPALGLEVTVTTDDELEDRPSLARYGFGAQFVEARVDVDTGEIRVPRMLGVFAVGRVLNARTARSQFLGGMTMGLSMALHEEGLMDLRFGDYANHDLATYHVSTCADVEQIDVQWLEEDDDQLNPMGSKGIGEIGIVGTAAAVTNAVYHATGVRVRDLPVRLDKLLGRMPPDAGVTDGQV